MDGDSQLIESILLMARERGLTKTFCPSEVARRLAPERDRWRSLMEPVRRAAAALIDRGQLVCKQKGDIVDIRTVRGPIRLQIKTSE